VVEGYLISGKVHDVEINYIGSLATAIGMGLKPLDARTNSRIRLNWL
jgi:hypothetical protein